MNVRIPPPIYMGVFGLLIYLSDKGYPLDLLPDSLGLLLSALCLLGASIFLLDSLFGFIRNKTTVNPLQPGKASALVLTGVYRVTRNPMYLGMALLLLALTAFLGNPIGLLFVLAFMLLIHKVQIKPEEAALVKKFGMEYEEYMKQVRRWI